MIGKILENNIIRCSRNMSDPLVSIITSVYNCERYIRESIESILSQTFSDFEFIILNDGSTDGTMDVVRSYKDNRIILVESHENWKIPKRRNQGIKMARGKYIAIHDGDDISKSYRLEMQVKILNEEGIFCVGGHAEKIDMNGDLLNETMDYPPTINEEIIEMITKKCMNPIIDPTTMFVRKTFIDLGYYTLDKSIYTVPDFDMWCKALLAGHSIKNIQQALINYRTNVSGMTGLHKDEMIRAHMIVWRSFMRSYVGNRRLKYVE